MASFLTSDTLIQSIERRGHIPQSQVTFQSDDYLAFANEEMSMGLVPVVLQFHEEFFVYTTNIVLQEAQSSYEIPSRAIGSKVRSIYYEDPQGNLKDMVRILPSDIPFFQKRSTVNYPNCFYLQNDQIVLVPEIPGFISGELVVGYFQRPNQLVAASRVANVVDIDFTTGVVTVDSIPSIFNSSTTIDFLEQKGSHKCLAMDALPSAVNTTLNTITFSPALVPASLSKGDMICLSGECYIPQIPDELHSVLAQRVVCRCLEAQGDAMGLQAANAKLQEMEVKMGNLIDNRTEGNPQKVNNILSPLRASKIRRRRNVY